jgi:hypothetical protein
MERTEIEAVLARHLEHFRQRDPQALASDHLPHGTFESPAHGLVSGRVGIEGVYRYWFTAFPDMRFEWDEPLVDGPRVALFWHFTGTVRGPFFGEAIDGARVEMRGAAEYVMESGGILSARHQFDFSGALIKAGSLKPRPSR